MWYFTSPQIVFGEGALAALDELHGRRALVVTDPTIVALGLVDRVTAHLEGAGLTCEIFADVEPDPSLETIRVGAQIARDAEPDWIVAVGGGSAMDAAKAIWITYERPDLDPAEINPIVELGLRKKARLITVPTTSGTGAEVTWAIVLTDTEAKRKLALGNREATADIAIVDPEMAKDMPRQLTVDTGLDALTHAVEGYTCTWHTDLTDGICLQAAQLVLTYLPQAAADGSNRVARERMHNAATLAGLGFGNAMASMAHACGHALGGCFHIPHGRAVGLLLPYTIQFMATEAPERFSELATALGWGRGDAEASARALADGLLSFRSDLDQPAALRDLGIAWADYEADLDLLVDNASNDACLMTAARSPSYEELRAIFESAYQGNPIDF
jgi:alcohol dehydrogenase class IV